MSRLEMCVEVLRESKKAMHVSEIADAVIDKFRLSEERDHREAFIKKINSTLSANFKSNNPQVSKPKNKQGKFKKGVYKIRAVRKRCSQPTPIPDVSTLYTGKAGEYALLSELLFRGYNASIMTVDEGIDIVASKDNKYYNVQVKTANVNVGKNKYLFTIKPSSYEANDASSTFYAFIMRRYINNLWRNEYVIISSIEIRRFIAEGVINSGKSYSLNIIFEDGACKLNGKKDITCHLNKFDILK